ncbi:MAG TPA: FAD-dependent monooxygenase [Actinocrinis sp.]
MRSLRVTVVGGGPAGLFLASLLRTADPSGEVTVYERNAPDATFGFGVVLSARTMTRLRAADPLIWSRLVAAGVDWDGIEFHRGGRTVSYAGHPLTAISRRTLLRILQERADATGARLVFGTEVDASVADAGADVVVLAAGANCALRDAWRERFGTSAEGGGGRYIWCGVEMPFDRLSFCFADGPAGSLSAHAYPYAAGLATYIVTTDEESWRAAMPHAVAGAPGRPGESDEVSLRALSEAFRDHLGGRALIGNNSRWAEFQVIRNARFGDGNRVLIGDAAHTAHPSVGSGTKLALDDAAALADALLAEPSVPAALARYEAERRPAVERSQAFAEPSMRWWEGYRERLYLELPQLGFHYLTRTSALDYSRLRRRDARAVDQAEQHFARRAPAGRPGLLADAAPSPADQVAMRNIVIGCYDLNFL